MSRLPSPISRRIGRFDAHTGSRVPAGRGTRPTVLWARIFDEQPGAAVFGEAGAAPEALRLVRERDGDVAVSRCLPGV